VSKPELTFDNETKALQSGHFHISVCAVDPHNLLILLQENGPAWLLLLRNGLVAQSDVLMVKVEAHTADCATVVVLGFYSGDACDSFRLIEF